MLKIVLNQYKFRGKDVEGNDGGYAECGEGPFLTAGEEGRARCPSFLMGPDIEYNSQHIEDGGEEHIDKSPGICHP